MYNMIECHQDKGMHIRKSIEVPYFLYVSKYNASIKKIKNCEKYFI